MKIDKSAGKIRGDGGEPADRENVFASLRDSVNLIGFSEVGLFIIAVGWVIYHSRAVLLPVVLALLVSMVLYPVYRTVRRLRLPPMLASTTTVMGLVALIGFSSYQLIEPGAQWMESMDREVVSNRLQQLSRPMHEVQSELKRVAHQMERVAQTENADASVKVANGSSLAKKALQTATDEGDEVEEDVANENESPVVVEIRQDPVDAVLTTMQDLGVGAAAFLFIVLFGLAYGNRIVRCMSKVEHTAAILERMGEEVSRYLFTITLINFCLGLAIGITMWWLNMPNPALWGVLGMVLNFIPYVGALIGTGMVFLAAAVSFDSPAEVLVVPIAYFVLTAIEGNVVTPMVLGERFRLNPLIVFLWIFTWGGFWGVAGMLIAMPALVTFKIVCEKTATMAGFRRVLKA